MSTRRDFLKGTVAAAVVPGIAFSKVMEKMERNTGHPTVISTWNFGMEANREAMPLLKRGKSALDAVEAGARVPEADPEIRSVGYGGRPDEDGHVTLDACIMDSHGNAGSVAFLQDIKHSVSVARKVMEQTDHVMLVGDGAKRFALSQGFKEEDLLTEESRKEWLKRKENLSGKGDLGPNENHDTISILAQDKDGNIAGACSTSGLAYKLHGRVGDSPIIGAALYCDNDIGAAGATGLGEAVIKTVGSFLVVELMRQGRSPQEACEEAVRRILRKHGGKVDFQVAYIALRIDGEIGAAAIKNGFQYALNRGESSSLIDVNKLTD
ncbi:MAG: N(4)-(beta-N-acetylglucosaminyl)-L-asparaginase [Candidatus Marinimicrobia bacterium]|jgi:isoaspartyl peptidase/L-asparaginase-like protein (Ntn-hydrolase superfamily)|nr:N(4)-(beta-N-acetylglucosaminyl)-L-asparaginase [Candidatus Neomarinimicrobiota bacterium]|tara:strand:+ start:1343 stop:2314 length:972 start_codon:yes stop_codon:yes gene_type:complete